MGGTRSRYEGRYIQGFLGGNLREGGYLEDVSVDGRVILNWIFKKLDGGMDWIDLAQDRDRWRCCECSNEVSGSLKCGNFLN